MARAGSAAAATTATVVLVAILMTATASFPPAAHLVHSAEETPVPSAGCHRTPSPSAGLDNDGFLDAADAFPDAAAPSQTAAPPPARRLVAGARRGAPVILP